MNVATVFKRALKFCVSLRGQYWFTRDLQMCFGLHSAKLVVKAECYENTTLYFIQRYWVFGLCPSSGFFLNNNEKHNVSETGSVSVLRWGKTPTLLGPLERANLNHCQSENPISLCVIHHCQNPVVSTIFHQHTFTSQCNIRLLVTLIFIHNIFLQYTAIHQVSSLC
jgi:hypothetical protein